jgi:hypothetical protein
VGRQPLTNVGFWGAKRARLTESGLSAIRPCAGASIQSAARCARIGEDTTGPNHLREPEGNLRQVPSFRDEGKLCSACLKCITGPSGKISLYFCPKTKT